jgi:hypothetical protein
MSIPVPGNGVAAITVTGPTVVCAASPAGHSSAITGTQYLIRPRAVGTAALLGELSIVSP